MKLNIPAGARLTDLVSGQSLDQTAIAAAVLEWQQLLQDLSARRLVLWADTSLDWVLLDIACLNSQQLFVPMPLFASHGQLAHVLASVGPEFRSDPNPVAEMFWRSYCSRRLAISQPPFSLPTIWSLGTFTSVKKVSQKGEEPLISRIGLVVTPSEAMSNSMKVMP